MTTRWTRFRFLQGLTALLLVGCMTCFATAQKDDPPAKPATETKPADKPPAKPADETKPTDKKDEPADPPKEKPPAGFDELLAEWEQIEKDLERIEGQYGQVTPSIRKVLLQQFKEQLARGHEILPKLLTAAQAAYAKAPNKDPRVTRTLIGFVANDMRNDRYQSARKTAQPLLDAKCEEEALLDFAGQAAYATDDFDTAEKLLGKVGEKLGADGTKLLADVSVAKELWKAEQQIRKAEATAKDLPRVKLETNKGELILELYENEAPQTVGNFISLVEAKKYDGLTFHRVMPGFMAQGGCPKGDGTGGPGYNIFCECYKENHRKHFRGSLSMAHAGRDTGGSQFFLTFQRTPHLDGKHTVFGRVVEGLEVLEKIQRRVPPPAFLDKKPLPTPDVIIKATVLNKREHEYKPVKVGDTPADTEKPENPKK